MAYYIITLLTSRARVESPVERRRRTTSMLASKPDDDDDDGDDDDDDGDLIVVVVMMMMNLAIDPRMRSAVVSYFKKVSNIGQYITTSTTKHQQQ